MVLEDYPERPQTWMSPQAQATWPSRGPEKKLMSIQGTLLFSVTVK